MVEELTVNSESFKLNRYPLRNNDPLRAWDAADEYLLQHLVDNTILTSDTQILIVNDSFGALTVPLSAHSAQIYTDSYISEYSIEQNLRKNSRPEQLAAFIHSTEQLKVNYDVVLIKVPKNQALLEHQLHKIKDHITTRTIVVAAGMVKTIHRSTLQLFESIIGPTTTSLAQKKSRLIFSQVDAALNNGTTPYPKGYELPEYNITVVNHANVFSRLKLDIGTRFFLQNLPRNIQKKDVIDLGCGNGLLGVIYARNNPGSRLTFIDESYMAVASAKINYENGLENLADKGEAQFLVGDCLTGVAENSTDLILNNPPFHQNTAVGDQIAWQMFNESKRVLRSGAELWVIGNRHLGYHTKLKRLFGNCETIASNQKFVLLKTRKR